MSTDRQVVHALRSWLHEDGHENADRVLDLVLDELQTTPQQRAPWRSLRLTLAATPARVGLAAVLLVAVIIGLRFLPGTNTGGPSPTGTPSPQATVVLPSSAFPPSGELAAGTVSMTRWGVPLTLELPADRWRSHDGFWIVKDVGEGPEGLNLLFWNAPPVNVFADPCRATTLDPPAGPSAAELATAMSAVPGTDPVSGPSDVTVGGYPATQVVIRVRDDIPCVPRTFNLWYSVGAGSECAGSGECGRFASGRDSTITVWIVDVNGTRIVIEGETFQGAGPGPGQEIQQIIDSIRFE